MKYLNLDNIDNNIYKTLQNNNYNMDYKVNGDLKKFTPKTMQHILEQSKDKIHRLGSNNRA